MDTTEIIVIIGGVALLAFVLWYFFGEREQVAAMQNASGVQEIKVMVKGGYSPDVIVVKEGSPVRLDFYRDETCFVQRASHLRRFSYRPRLARV